MNLTKTEFAGRLRPARNGRVLLVLCFLVNNILCSAAPLPAGKEEKKASQSVSGSSSPASNSSSLSPPIGSFGKELLGNFKGMFSKENLFPVLVGSAATGLSFAADDGIRDHFNETRRFRELGEFGNIVGHSAVQGAFAATMLVLSYETNNDRFRRMGFSLGQGFLINAAWTAGLKAAISRDRPNEESGYSMPSGHTSGTMVTATVISHYYPKATIPAYSVAAIVGFSRVEKNRHYLSDVVAGATLGFIVGRTVVRGTDSFGKGKVSWMPVVLPDPGVAVALRIRLED